MAEGVGKDGLAAGVDELADGVGAGGVFPDVGLDHHLGVVVHAQGLAGGLHALDVVLVVGVGGLAHQDQADLQVGGGDAFGFRSFCGLGGLFCGFFFRGLGVGGPSAGGQADSHHARQEKCENTLFHAGVPP